MKVHERERELQLGLSLYTAHLTQVLTQVSLEVTHSVITTADIDSILIVGAQQLSYSVEAADHAGRTANQLTPAHHGETQPGRNSSEEGLLSLGLIS